MQPAPQIGVIPREEDCRVPEGAKVFDLKACENCGNTFMRERRPLRKVVLENTKPWGLSFQEWQRESTVYIETGERYCRECRLRLLQPPSREEEDVYRDQLPSHVPCRLPHYDNSIGDRRQVTKIYSRWHKDWRERLITAFKERGPLSVEAIIGVVGSKVTNPRHRGGILECVSNGFIGIEIKIVASEWPRKNGMGPARKLFYPVTNEEHFG